MRTFFSILKNDYMRTLPRIASVAVITAIALASIVLAVHMTGVQQVKGHIVLIRQNAAASTFHTSEYLDIRITSERPPYSALVEHKYDAFVTVSSDGTFHIETLRSDDFRNVLASMLENPDAPVKESKTERGAGVNILGFMMMFLLMISFSNLFVFADDKEQGQLRRISAAPVSFGWYLAAHCFYGMTLLVPEYLLLAVLKLRGWNIGFSLPQFAGLMAVLGFLGISFAMILNTLIQKPDNANMLGNSVTVLTTVLAGSFYSFSRNNPVLDHLVGLLPQKELMNFAMYLQNGEAAGHQMSLMYVVAFSLVLFFVSVMILRKMYVKAL